MEKAKIDVAVLLLFFARPEQTAKVFKQIKIARPSKLFLYQDGAREGRSDDIAGVEACRKIVENIDWECEVHRMYQEKNYGCDPSEYISQKWMFSIVDKGIILEDDDVPSQSFFPFCKELLDKYEDDNRIAMICGMNHCDQIESQYDYTFVQQRGPIWGWATWKRFIDTWDPTYEWMDNKEILKVLKRNGPFFDYRLEILKKNRLSNVEHYEDFVYITRYLYNQLAIIPTKNLISNIGLTPNATHCSMTLKDLPPKGRKMYYKKTYSYKFPLVHPTYIIRNLCMEDAIEEAMHYGWKEKIFLYFKKIVKFYHKIRG